MKRSMRIFARIREVFLLILASVGIAISAYGVFALLFTTDLERKLDAECREYARIVSGIDSLDSQRSASIAYLQHRDNAIYELVFHSGSPDVRSLSYEAACPVSDTASEAGLVSRTYVLSRELMSSSARIDSSFNEIFRLLSLPDSPRPPIVLPFRIRSYMQVGAGKGKKMSPFLKAVVDHDGIDLIAERGDTVFAPAAGTVSYIQDSRKGRGKVLSINHGDGYSTEYMHLANILVVPGAEVSAGEAVATVGMTGNSFSPHLHYEIHRNGVPLSPADYFFASLTPADYTNMLYMSENTIQSMD